MKIWTYILLTLQLLDAFYVVAGGLLFVTPTASHRTL